MGQSPTVLRQPPQRHANRPPTRATSDVISDVGSCATTKESDSTNAATSFRFQVRRKPGASLRLNGLRYTRNAYHLRARVLQAHLTGNQANQSAKQQDPISNPNPGHQWELVELERR